jgi:hypothetical protein
LTGEAGVRSVSVRSEVSALSSKSAATALLLTLYAKLTFARFTPSLCFSDLVIGPLCCRILAALACMTVASSSLSSKLNFFDSFIIVVDC